MEGNKINTETVQILGREIRIHRVFTENGISVILEGGDKGHIGAVTVVGPGIKMNTTVFPGHKESLISEFWARKLVDEYACPVVVSAGVHFDNVTKEEIMEAVDLLFKALPCSTT